VTLNRFENIIQWKDTIML